MPVPDFSPGEVLTAAAMDSIGLWLVKTQTVGAGVASVTVTDAFSSSFQNYRVILAGCDASSANQAITFTIGNSIVSYFAAAPFWSYTGTSGNLNRNNQASAYVGVTSADNNTQMIMDIQNPNAAEFTTFQAKSFGNTAFLIAGGHHTVATAYTSFTLGPATGTFTGGTIRVYGYRD
jgi:hypothetical protein